MKNFLWIFFITFCHNLSSGQENFIITPIVPSFISTDNASAGFMVTLKSGRIIHFFRLDTGPGANHTGNNGRIVKNFTDDGGKKWSKPVTIFDDEYDDRNVSGGILKTGRIVVFFRRYNSDLTHRLHIDYNLIYSDDNGETWSPKIKINSVAEASNSPLLPYIPGKGYMSQVITASYIETRYSNEGINWNNIGKVWDYRKDKKFKINEICCTYTNNGRIIGLIKDDPEFPAGKSYYQVTSSDYGNTWSEPEYTNIAENYYCGSPLVFYDSKHFDLWAIATDRRYRVPQFYQKSEIWIYRNKVEEIMNNPKSWQLVKKFPRPYPNPYIFYGYPCVTQKTDGSYLVVFTESYLIGGREHADFYQFEIKYIE